MYVLVPSKLFFICTLENNPGNNNRGKTSTTTIYAIRNDLRTEVRTVEVTDVKKKKKSENNKLF